MNAATPLEKQIERYRQMTGEQRLGVALELHECAAISRAKGFAAKIQKPMSPKSSDFCIVVLNLPSPHE